MKRFPSVPAACAGLLLLAACQDSPIAPSPEKAIPAAASVQTGWIIGPGDEPMEVRYSIIDGMSILEGDINLGPAGTVPRTRAELLGRPGGPRYGVVINGYRWYNGYVPFSISNSFSVAERQVILNAIAHVAGTTAGTSFVARTGQADYINFVPHATACNSWVGKQGGAQTINLAPGCTGSVGIVAHEILHSLGVWHEQSRCDRDNFVTINLANVQPGAAHNFDRKCGGSTSVFAYNEGSVMHYGPWDFSVNGQQTITSRRGLDFLMGQRNGLNQTDVSTVNWMYQPYAPSGISITDQSGSPLISWNSSNGAIIYGVNLVVMYEEYDDQLNTSVIYEQTQEWLGTTSSTSIFDTQRPYTGNTHCIRWSTYSTTAYDAYYYDITAGFPDGIDSRTIRVNAPVAPSSC